MNPVSTACGAFLVLLGCWAVFTMTVTLKSRRGWSRHRPLVLVAAAFVASCWLPGGAMLGGNFRPWMSIPLGLCYWALIPLPCYFRWANHGWIHKVRTVLFLLIGAMLVAAGFGVGPVTWAGWLAGA